MRPACLIRDAAVSRYRHSAACNGYGLSLSGDSHRAATAIEQALTQRLSLVFLPVDEEHLLQSLRRIQRDVVDELILIGMGAEAVQALHLDF